MYLKVYQKAAASGRLFHDVNGICANVYGINAAATGTAERESIKKLEPQCCHSYIYKGDLKALTRSIGLREQGPPFLALMRPEKLSLNIAADIRS